MSDSDTGTKKGTGRLMARSLGQVACDAEPGTRSGPSATVGTCTQTSATSLLLRSVTDVGL